MSQSVSSSISLPLGDPSRLAILLDVDGTLLDIAPTPDAVRVSAALRDTLECLWTKLDGALAFVSGRSLSNIDALFEPLKLPAIGGHGAEMRASVNGKVHQRTRAPLSDELRAALGRIGNLSPRLIVEDKGYSVAIHYRLDPTRAGDVVKAVTAACGTDESLEILPGKAVIEVKHKGFNKGTALRELMQIPPFSGRKPIFVGDDVTDDAALAVLPEFDGIGFSVGGVMPGAAFKFDGPHDVRAWLQQICEIDVDKANGGLRA